MLAIWSAIPTKQYLLKGMVSKVPTIGLALSLLVAIMKYGSVHFGIPEDAMRISL
jgi:hypothetical protein